MREPTRTETKSSSVLIHLGVHSTLRGYRVERVAWDVVQLSHRTLLEENHKG